MKNEEILLCVYLKPKHIPVSKYIPISEDMDCDDFYMIDEELKLAPPRDAIDYEWEFTERFDMELVGVFTNKDRSCELREQKIGDLSGYYMDKEYLDDLSDYDRFYEFDGVSHMTLVLYSYIKDRLKELTGNFIYITLFNIEEIYYSEELEKICIENLPGTLLNIYKYNMPYVSNYIFYSTDSADIKLA